jgi:hypothetical protein
MIRYLFLLSALASLLGCGSNAGENFDSKGIAVNQPGSAPPPMNPPGAPGNSR